MGLFFRRFAVDPTGVHVLVTLKGAAAVGAAHGGSRGTRKLHDWRGGPGRPTQGVIVKSYLRSRSPYHESSIYHINPLANLIGGVENCRGPMVVRREEKKPGATATVPLLYSQPQALPRPPQRRCATTDRTRGGAEVEREGVAGGHPACRCTRAPGCRSPAPSWRPQQRRPASVPRPHPTRQCTRRK